MFQRYLQQFALKLLSKNELDKCFVSVREIYIQNEDNNEDTCLFNAQWKILPSISCIEGKGLYILTCKILNVGTKCLMSHPCR